MLDRIHKLNDLIQVTEDALERRKDNLCDLVYPAFAAATGWNRTPRSFDVRLRHGSDMVSISWQDQWRGDYDEFEMPRKIFEAEDPVKAATEWRNRSTAQKKAKEKAARKKSLQRQLAALEAEDEMD